MEHLCTLTLSKLKFSALLQQSVHPFSVQYWIQISLKFRDWAPHRLGLTSPQDSFYKAHSHTRSHSIHYLLQLVSKKYQVKHLCITLTWTDITKLPILLNGGLLVKHWVISWRTQLPIQYKLNHRTGTRVYSSTLGCLLHTRKLQLIAIFLQW